MIQAIWIPEYLPPALNQVMRGHWANGHRLKKACAEMIGAYWLQHAGRNAEGKRRVSLQLILKAGQRRFDRDAFWKATLDALKQCGALKEDSPKWCITGDVVYSRAEDGGAWGCLILLEDI